jgi:sec-independent protein translocase protein TatC
MSWFGNHNYSEDMFADTRMSFGEHLEELRLHLWRAIAGFGVALFFSFFIGWYVLDFIKAPVRQQLEEFYTHRAKSALKDMDHNAKLKEVNRSQFVRMSFLPQQFQAAKDGKSPPEALAPLPENGAALPYADLMERAQLQTVAAFDALNLVKWDLVKQAADDLEHTAGRLPQAIRVPEPAQADLSGLAERLTREAGQLRADADRADPEQAEKTLQRIQDALADRGLVQLWVRVEQPVRFFALFQGALMQVYRRPDLSALSVQEAFMAYFKVCIVCGIVLGSPWIFWQIWQFVAAGLYPHEKRLVNVYLPFSLGLFLAGVLVCQFLVIPKAIEALLWFNEWLNLEPDLRFNEWLSFAIMMPLVFGISFQLPLVMMFLERIGVLTVESYYRKWRIACFLIHVFAAVITPSVDIVSMEALALPMFGLYGLGILLCKFNRRKPDLEEDVPETQEMVEV